MVDSGRGDELSSSCDSDHLGQASGAVSSVNYVLVYIEQTGFISWLGPFSLVPV